MAEPAADFVAAARAARPDAVPTCALTCLLDQAAARRPDAVAIDFMGARTSYRQLEAAVARAARGLQALGVGPGERVGLCLPNTPYFAILYFAVLRVGAVVVNFNPLYVERELAFQITDSGTTVMVTVDLAAVHDKLVRVAEAAGLRRIVVCSFADALPPAKALAFRLTKRALLSKGWSARDGLHLPYAALIADRRAPEPVGIDPERDVAVIQYTGGTTGEPKGAVLTHANLSANCAQIIHHVGEAAPGEQRIMAVLPLFHVFALSFILNYGIATGAELVLLPRFDLAGMLKAVRRSGATSLPAVPTIYNAVNSAPARLRGDLSSLQFCISGGAPLPAEVKARFEALTGCKLVEGYGLSETAPVVAVNPLDGPGRAGSVGRPVVGTTVELRGVEDPARRLGPGERGEVCVRGPQVMAGYWNRPDGAGEVFVDGAFRTGDIGYLDEDGYLFLVDRKKDMILCGGYNVYPRVIEEALYAHPAVAEASVIGVPDPYRGEAPKAFVALKPGEAATAETLKAHLALHLNRLEMPREIEFRDSLPKTTIGKLSKVELAAEEAARREASA